MLTPADIGNKRFTSTRFREGYDMAEVDDFLDHVVIDFEGTLQRLAVLQDENATLRRKLEGGVTQQLPAMAPTPSAAAERLLAVAQQAAEQMQAEAEAEASQIRAAAAADADGIREAAHREAAGIAAGAEEKRQETLNHLEEHKALLEGEIGMLQARRLTVKSVLESTLAKLQEGDVFDG